MTTTEPRSRQLSDMAECAYRLGMAFGAAAETAQGTDRWLTYFNAFDRCFFAVRVSTALELRLGREPAEPREAASDRETLIDRPDPPETEDRERDDDALERERDRDRETERASLPILLRTLEGVVADAAMLPEPAPAELITLRELIAHAKAEPRPASPTPQGNRISQSTAGALAAGVLDSTAEIAEIRGGRRAPAAALRISAISAVQIPAAPHRASNVGQVLAARRATGPPRR